MTRDRDITDELVEKIVCEISRRYRIVPDAAKRVLARHMSENKKLSVRLQTAARPEDIERLHEFREAVKNAKKEIYYNLRRYHHDKQAEKDLIDELERRIKLHRRIEEIEHVRDELLVMHSSTAERFEHYAAFYEELFRITLIPGTILDVACGIHPLSYPFKKRDPSEYVAIDKDELCIRAVNAFAQLREIVHLRGIQSSIEEIEWQDIATRDMGRFDLAFMLKIIPVIKRRDDTLLRRLAEVPAQRILITANAEALTKRVRVSRREDRALRSFIEMSGRKIVSEFRIPNEFGYLIE
jgi:16S rRNA (guanine(1405)-N(7))-methyltransferase